MKITWMTDVHMNFVPNEKMLFGGGRGGLDLFLDEIRHTNPDALFVTGDIAEAPSLPKFLEMLGSIATTYFVLGNHDYYHGSIAKVREWAREVTADESSPLIWMNEAGVVPLTDQACVVGVDGWGDAQYGNPTSSRVVLNDWYCIKELVFRRNESLQTHWDRRVPALRKLGEAEARTLSGPLVEALERFETVYVLTHVPPWDTATWHEGEHSDPDWQPWFSCKAVGDLIEECAAQFPDTKVTVFCGHTHGEGYCERLPNLECFTGGARYRCPKVQKSFEI